MSDRLYSFQHGNPDTINGGKDRTTFRTWIGVLGTMLGGFMAGYRSGLVEKVVKLWKHNPVVPGLKASNHK